jgi:hypothetical protein
VIKLAQRIKVGEEKKLPDLNFKLKLFINFSVSTNKELSIQFARICGNDDETKSKKLRKIVYAKLGCKDQKEFEKLFIEEVNYIRDKIKNKIKEKNKFEGNDWFSGMVRDSIQREVKKSDEK